MPPVLLFPLCRGVLRPLLGAMVLLFAVLSPARAADAPARQTFDLGADRAEPALKKFSAQSGRQVLFPTDLVQGVRTNAVKGDYTAREALDRMLAGTPLYAVQDEATGALAILRTENPEKKVPSPAASLAAADGPAVKLAEVEVTGSRIRTLLGEADFSPVVSFGRAEIEQAGVTTLGELSRLIPQAYSQGSYDGMGLGGQSQGQTVTSDGSTTNATNMRTSFNLRGLGTNNTLVLVDGRRLARTGTVRNAEGYDLAGIPVSAVERVEVVTDGASAIYGSDALGGVVNLILKKNYSGTEISYSYENTVDTDTAAQTASLIHGIRRDKLTLLLSVSGQDRNAFAAVDRDFSATDNWVSLGGTSSPASFAGGGFALGAGLIQAFSGNLPGRTSPYALIPEGATGSARPASDYVSVPTSGLSPYVGDRAKYAQIISPQQVASAGLRFGFDLRPSLQFFGDFRWSRTETEIHGLPVNYRNGIIVPANYPGNPFGVPVRLNKTFWELDPISGERDASSTHFAASAGVRGDLAHDWRYELGFDWDRAILEQEGYSPVIYTEAFDALVAQRALTFFYDSRTQTPNDLGVLRSLLEPEHYEDRTGTAAAVFSADGPIWSLPAGPVRLAIGGEYREETYDIEQFTTGTLASRIVLGGHERRLESGYAETRIPLLGPAQHLLLVNRLDATAAIRYDHYSDVGGDDSPRYGLQWRPVSWLLLRGTRNYAFRAPSIDQLRQPVFPSTNINTSGFIDRQTGTLITGQVDTVNGGNPDLKPEHAISDNFGVVFDVPLRPLKGLSLSFDVIDIEYQDQIAVLSTLQEWADLFPERLIRNAAGRVTGVDNRRTNISRLLLRSYDYQLSYRRDTRWGNFSARVAATDYDQWDAIRVPGAAAVTTLHQRPVRLSWQTYWSKGPLGAGVSGFYQDEMWTAANRAQRLFGSAIEWNAQVAYDFGYSSSALLDAEGRPPSRWQLLRTRPLADTKLSLSVFNVFDREPPHRQGSAGFGVTDPRMLRYVVSLRKKF